MIEKGTDSTYLNKAIKLANEIEVIEQTSGRLITLEEYRNAVINSGIDKLSWKDSFKLFYSRYINGKGF